MVQYGIDQLLGAYHALIDRRRLGLISHYAMTDGSLRPVIDRLRDNPASELVRLFGPEHGVLNAAREGEPIEWGKDAHSGLEAVSLYGSLKAPRPDMLTDLDVLVIDLADIGCRYYTNASTLYYAIESAASVGIPVVVLDRPNPLGGIRREGLVLDRAFQSFVGMLPVPIRHGLTFGEQARLIQRQWFPKAAIAVVPVSGWTRHMLWPELARPFVPPSPNTTSFEMALLYPGMCLFEGTNVSVGRGTTHPFEWVGAPWADGHAVAEAFNAAKLPGVYARPVYFTPWRSLYASEMLSGVHIHVTDPPQVESLRTGMVLLHLFSQIYPNRFEWRIPGEHANPRFFDLLAGGTALRQAIQSDRMSQYFAQEAEQIRQFSQSIAPIILYQN